MSEIKDMSVKELKQELTTRGVDFSDCIEKSELVARLTSARLSSPQPPLTPTKEGVPKDIDDPVTEGDINFIYKNMNQALSSLEHAYPPDHRLISKFRGLLSGNPMRCMSVGGNSPFIEIAIKVSKRLLDDHLSSISTNFMNLIASMGIIATLDDPKQKSRVGTNVLLQTLSKACELYNRGEYFREVDRQTFIRIVTMLLSGITAVDEVATRVMRAPHLFETASKAACRKDSIVFSLLFIMNASFDDYGRELLRKSKPKIFAAMLEFLKSTNDEDFMQHIYLTLSNLCLYSPHEYKKTFVNMLIEQGFLQYLYRDIRRLVNDAIGMTINLIQENDICEGILTKELMSALADAASTRNCTREIRRSISSVLVNLAATKSAPKILLECNARESLEKMVASKQDSDITRYAEVLLVQIKTFTGEIVKVDRKCSSLKCQVRADKLKKCSGCESIWYCSTECQKEDWPRHKQFCKIFKQSNDHNVPKKQATMDRTVALNFFQSHAQDWRALAKQQDLPLGQCVVVGDFVKVLPEYLNVYSIDQFYKNIITKPPFTSQSTVDLIIMKESHAKASIPSFIAIFIQVTSISAFVLPL